MARNFIGLPAASFPASPSEKPPDGRERQEKVELRLVADRSGTLAGIESLVRQIEPDIEVVAV